uniref:Uncharacterized protein n=1 Tax=Rhizophora mucronata TaxID=61149 RepID=A0A2P2Q2E1_RHIMU
MIPGTSIQSSLPGISGQEFASRTIRGCQRLCCIYCDYNF